MQKYLNTQSMTMMFEVQDLAVASPATVSRCGMVYLEPSILGLMPFVECWLRQLPSPVFNYRAELLRLFSIFLEVNHYQLDSLFSVYISYIEYITLYHQLLRHSSIITH